MTNPFTAFAYEANGTGVNTPINTPDRLAYVKDVKNYGALGDGTGALLNTRYGSLAAAQADYPFVTNIATQSIDWAAIQAAFYNVNVTAITTQAQPTGTFSSVTYNSGTNTITFVTSSPHGVSMSDPTSVQIYGISGVTENSEIFTATIVDASTFTVPIASNPGSSFSGTTFIFLFLRFASVPAGILNFSWQTFDLTNISNIAHGGSQIVGQTSTTVTISGIDFFELVGAPGTVGLGDVIAFRPANRGTIYLPAGTYVVSQPIDFWDLESVTSSWTGELGLSIITGNFNDFVLSRGANNTGAADGGHTVENLTLINTHATGGGLRFGGSVNGAARNLNITANRGITTLNIDTVTIPDNPNAYWGSLEMSFENCTLSPGSNVTGSIGMQGSTDGPYANLSIVGFESGMRLFAGEGAMAVTGCYFEKNGTALALSIGPDGTSSFAGTNYICITGCIFKNNSIAIFGGAGNTKYMGLYIEGTNGAAPGSTNPQYGIQVSPGTSQFMGITVTGQYDKAAVALLGGAGQNFGSVMGVQASNSSATGGAVVWSFPSTALAAQFTACNQAPVYTMSQLPATAFNITGASITTTGAVSAFGSLVGGTGYVGQQQYFNVPLTGGTGTGAVAFEIDVNASGVVTRVILGGTGSGGSSYTNGDVLSASNANLGGSGSGFSITITASNIATITVGSSTGLASQFADITVSGVTPAGYNGVFTAAECPTNLSILYPISTSPGSGTGGSVLVNPRATPQDQPLALEGDQYSVSNAGSSTWGASALPANSTHALVRWNGAQWGVMGI